MDSNNLIFCSKIDPQVEEACFDILLDYLSDKEYDNVYVNNVVLASNEIIFFAKIDGFENVIRIYL
jgi:hypothetical protein